MAVSYSLENSVAHINFDDGQKNVINHDVLDQLEEAWISAQSEAKAIVISGRPGSFCAGYDLSVMMGEDSAAAVELGARGGKLAHQIFGSDIPVVGCSMGHAFTIGALWLACCDVRIGEEGNFKYGMTEVALNVGFSPWLLVPLREAIHPRYFNSVVMHSRVFQPPEAREAGFIDELLPSGAGLERAKAVAAQLSELPSKAYIATKTLLRSEGLAIMAKDLGL